MNDTTPRKCDDSQGVVISNMKAACARVTSTATSDTHFLGERTEEFVSTTYEMANAITTLHKQVFQSAHDTKNVVPFHFGIVVNVSMQPRKAEVSKRTLSALLSKTIVLMYDLEDFHDELSVPFGRKEDGLLPRYALCDRDCQEGYVFMFDDFRNFSGRGISSS